MRRIPLFVVLLAAIPAAAQDTAPAGADKSPPAATEKPKDEAPPKPAAPVVTVPTYPNPTCPIMGKPVSDLLFTEVEEGRIYLCCPPCAKKVRKDPKRAYEAAYPASKSAGNKVCPITGEAVKAGGPTVLIQGITIAVSAEECVAAVRANTQIALAKAMDPAVKDVGNATCPITGAAVAKNAFCLVDKELVRLSSSECVEAVRKDPAAALKKAKEFAAAAATPRAPEKPKDGATK